MSAAQNYRECIMWPGVLKALRLPLSHRLTTLNLSQNTYSSLTYLEYLRRKRHDWDDMSELLRQQLKIPRNCLVSYIHSFKQPSLDCV